MKCGLAFGSCLLILLVETNAATRIHAQDQPSPAIEQQAKDDVLGYPQCAPRSIDVTFTFADQPAGAQTISLHLQNTGSSACRLDGSVVPSFAVDSHSMWVESCWYCRKSDSAPKPSGQDHFVLAPNDRAVVDLRWASTGKSCQWSDWAFINADWAPKASLIFTPSNWPMHICSMVEGLGYRHEPSQDRTTAEEPLRVTVSPDMIYNDEYATLHVEMTAQPNTEPDPDACADLYTVRQDSSSTARLDPLPARGGLSVSSYTPMQKTEDRERSWPSWKKAGERECAAKADATAVDALIRAEALAQVTHIEWQIAPSSGKEPEFLTVATHFTVLDADSLVPHWGESTQGIRAGLSVDRESFRMGERIPMHIRWENVGAVLPLEQGECREPWPSLEIQDENHKVIKTVELFPLCQGHGWGPFVIKQGEPHREYRELGTTAESMKARFFYADNLPGPGVYYLVTVWTPRILERIDLESDAHRWSRAEGKVGGSYGIARSLPVRIDVLPN
jgi:hypothetical protein